MRKNAIKPPKPPTDFTVAPYPKPLSRFFPITVAKIPFLRMPHGAYALDSDGALRPLDVDEHAPEAVLSQMRAEEVLLTISDSKYVRMLAITVAPEGEFRHPVRFLFDNDFGLLTRVLALKARVGIIGRALESAESPDNVVMLKPNQSVAMLGLLKRLHMASAHFETPVRNPHLLMTDAGVQPLPEDASTIITIQSKKSKNPFVTMRSLAEIEQFSRPSVSVPEFSPVNVPTNVQAYGIPYSLFYRLATMLP